MPTPVDLTKSVTAIDAGMPPQRLSVEAEPQKNDAVVLRDKSSISSMNPERPEAQPEKKGVLNTISSAISNFFSSAIGWAWGSTPAKTVPADMKVEGGTVEGIASRPVLSKPEVKNLENYLAAAMRPQVRKVKDDNEDIETELMDAKNFNEKHLIALLVIVLKDQKKNNETSIIILNDKLKNLQSSIESLAKEKRINDEKADGFHDILKITGHVATVGVFLTVGGLVITGAIVLTGGAAAIPAGFAIAQAAVGAIQAFNQLAKQIVSEKLKKNQGESTQLTFKQDQAMFQRQMTYGDIKTAIAAAFQAEKTMLEQAQKLRYAQPNIL